MNGLSVLVRTRSKVLDYRFIGAANPPERWWEKGYGRWTDFSRPTILVEPGRFFISGIGSKRTDSKGTRIHYALHGQVEPEGRALAARVLAYFCQVRGRTQSLDQVGQELDRISDDLWSAAVQGDPAAEREVGAGVAGWLEGLPGNAGTEHDARQAWIEAPDEQSFEMLAQTAAAVIESRPHAPKLAAYLNLASSSELLELTGRGAVGIVCRGVDARPKPSRSGGVAVMLATAGLILVALLLVYWNSP